MENHQNLIDVLKAVQAAVLIIDRNSHHVIFSNETAQNILGVGEEELTRKRCFYLFQDRIDNKCPVCDLGQSYDNKKLTIQRSSGEAVTIVKSVKHIQFKGKDCLLETFIDVTEMENLKNAVEDEKKRLDIALKTASSGIWEYYCQEEKLIYGIGAPELLGLDLDKNEINIHRWLELIHPDFREELSAGIAKLHHGDPEEFDSEFRIRKKGGYYGWIHSVGTLVERDREGMPYRYVGLSQEIDEKKKKEQHYKQQSELQSLLFKTGNLSDKLIEITSTLFRSLSVTWVGLWIDSQIALSLVPQDFLKKNNMSLFSSEGEIEEKFTNEIPHHFAEDENIYVKYGLCCLPLATDQNDIVGQIVISSQWIFTDEEIRFIRDLSRLTVQVIENSISEKMLKEALELTEKANRLMEGREARIRDIKKEINELTSKLGWGNIYKDFDADEISDEFDMSDMMALRKNALSLAEDAEIERKRAVEANRALLLIKHAVNSSSDGIIITKSNGDIYHVNQTFTDLFGHSAAKMMVFNQSILFSEDSLYDEIYMNVVKEQEWKGVVQSKKSNGNLFSAHLRVSLIRDEDGIEQGQIWHYMDITQTIEDQKKIKKDLKEKQDLLRKAMILQNSYIQRSVPQANMYNLDAMFHPCEALGGDFFRILKGIREDKLIVIIGDCTGHGIKASMDASLLSSLSDPLLHYLYEGNRTDLFLNAISKQFAETSDDDQFPTMFVMVIDCNDNACFYSSANSTNPIVLRDERLFELPKAQGFHIAYEDNPQYERKSFPLENGDRILFYSDALVEKLVDGHLRFDMSGLNERFLQDGADPHKFFDSINRLMENEERFFHADDDITLIEIEHRVPLQVNFNFSHLDEWNSQLEIIKSNLKDFRYTTHEIEPLCISLDEMCINAYVHGNKRDHSKSVSISGEINCQMVKLRICDEGKGFSPEEIPNPADILQELLNEDVEEKYTHGRGIWVSRKYLDDITYSPEGNSVEVLFCKRVRSVLVSN